MDDRNGKEPRSKVGDKAQSGRHAGRPLEAPGLAAILLDSMTEGVSLSAEDGTIVYTNPAEDRMFGYNPGELVGQHVSVQNAYPPAENTRIVADVIAHLQQSGSWRGEWLNRRKDGSVFFTTSRISAVEVDGRRHWLCVQEDASDQRRAAIELQQSQARLELATEAAELGIWDWDVPSGQMTYSPRAKAICGFPLELDVTFENARDIVHPEDRPRTLAMAARALDPALREQQPYEYRIVRRDGSERWVLAYGEAVFEQVDGEVRAVRYVGTLQDVTERHRLEEAERLAAQTLSLAVAAGRMAVWEVDLRTSHISGSPELNRMLGFPAEATPTDEEIRAGYYPGERERMQAAGQAAMARGERFIEVEFRYVWPDGSVRWLLLRAEAVMDAGGQPVRAVGVLMDITDRKRAEDELRQSNERLEERVAETLAERKLLADMVESTDAFVQAADLEFRWLAINKAAADEFERIFGLRPKVGESMLDLLAGKPEHRAAVQAVWARALAGEEFTEVAEFGDPELGRRAYEMKYNVLRDASGRQIGAYQFVYDVTQRVREQQRLAEAEAARRNADALYRAYFENTPEALFVIGVEPDGGFIVEEINPAHEAGVGLKLDAIRGKRIEDILPAPAAERVIEGYRRVVETGAIYQYREEFDLAAGEPQHWDTSLVPMRDETGRIIRLIGSSRNVTRQVVAEEALRQSQKMEAVGQLTGGIAHDFNNLLQAVHGNLDLIRRKPSSDKVLRWAENGLQATARGTKLTAQLLAFSRAQRLELRAVALSPLILNIEELLQRTLGPSIRVRLDLRTDDAAVMADPTQLEMALLNLAINSRDAMPTGGEVTISSSRRLVEDDPQLKPGAYLEVRVSDTGEGMPANVIGRAFDPFFTTKEVGKGTGLGLSQVYGMAIQAGGTARIESRPGQGTSVSIWLRCTDRPTEAGTMVHSDAQSADTAPGRTVLVIDDDPDVRRLLADTIEALGYRALQASNGPAGLEVLDSSKPDIVVVDFAMPGMNGAEVAAEIRKRRPGLPIVFASGYSDTDAIDRSLGPTATVLRKPFGVAELEAMLANQLA
jgi:PAS domain S-box-containing protein